MEVRKSIALSWCASSSRYIITWLKWSHLRRNKNRLRCLVHFVRVHLIHDDNFVWTEDSRSWSHHLLFSLISDLRIATGSKMLLLMSVINLICIRIESMLNYRYLERNILAIRFKMNRNFFPYNFRFFKSWWILHQVLLKISITEWKSRTINILAWRIDSLSLNGSAL